MKNYIKGLFLALGSLILGLEVEAKVQSYEEKVFDSLWELWSIPAEDKREQYEPMKMLLRNAAGNQHHIMFVDRLGINTLDDVMTKLGDEFLFRDVFLDKLSWVCDEAESVCVPLSSDPQISKLWSPSMIKDKCTETKCVVTIDDEELDEVIEVFKKARTELKMFEFPEDDARRFGYGANGYEEKVIDGEKVMIVHRLILPQFLGILWDESTESFQSQLIIDVFYPDKSDDARYSDDPSAL